jgi:hypothetical protein
MAISKSVYAFLSVLSLIRQMIKASAPAISAGFLAITFVPTTFTRILNAFIPQSLNY